MSASVLPYTKIVQNENENEKDRIVIQFSGMNSKILVNESYCVNPACSCTDVVLSFIELADDGYLMNEWFTIRLDMNSWKVTDKKKVSKKIGIDEMIKEFMNDIDKLKDKLLIHAMKAKEYGRKHYLEYIYDSNVKMLLDGEMVAYAEIFGSLDFDLLSFELTMGEKWFIDDQYCSNPKCQCNDAVLSFIKIDDSVKTQKPEFAVRMNLKDFKYVIEYNQCGTEKINEIIKYLRDKKPELFAVLRRRYQEIKVASKEVIKKFNLETMKDSQANVKIGRNDPCPCGSGKKYKRCCGV